MGTVPTGTNTAIEMQGPTPFNFDMHKGTATPTQPAPVPSIDSILKLYPPGTSVVMNPDGGISVTPAAPTATQAAAMQSYATQISSVVTWALNPMTAPLAQLLTAWNALDAAGQEAVKAAVNAYAAVHPGFNPQWFLQANPGLLAATQPTMANVMAMLEGLAGDVAAIKAKVGA